MRISIKYSGLFGCKNIKQVICRLAKKRFKTPHLFLLVICLTLCMLFISKMFIATNQDLQDMKWDIYVTRNQDELRIIGSLCEGRLGNNMFCFASLQGIANDNNIAAVFDSQSLLHNVFQTKKRALIKEIGTKTLGKYTTYQELGSRAGAYDRTTGNLTLYLQKNTNVFIQGYLQSWIYFRKIENKVRLFFTFHKTISSAAAKCMSKYSSMQKASSATLVRVGIHVRRGDMAHEEALVEKGYTVPDADYFYRAMEYFRKRFINVLFIICSDDMIWTKTNIKGSDIIYSEGNNAGVDLAILANCDHVIVSVGSFGWWGAWLANGTTIYYKDWPKPNSKLDFMVDKNDYFKPDWIAM